jgi:radical SAM protein with 4Fe4S-binding SPASM domain
MKNGDQPILRLPSFQDQRGDAFLMVWGDLPYWTVVDAELRDLLRLLDGTRTLAEVTKSVAGRRQRKEARRALKLFAARGVVTSGEEVGARPSANGAGRIENIAINVTRRCNLRCRFCYNLDCLVDSPEGELSLADTIDVLEASRPFWGDTVALSILGGEPLLAEDKTLGLLTYAERNGLVPIVSTNGTLVTPGFAKHASTHGAEMQVSIDGAFAETSDQVRGKGSFVRAVEGVKTLVEAGAQTILSMVCHQGNVAELEKFYELGLRLGVSEVRFIPLKRMGGADTSGFEPVPLGELITRAVSLFREHPEYKPLTGRDAFSIIASTCQYAVGRVSCGTGVQTFLLDANGDIYPCLNTNIDSLRVANVGDADFSFAKVWQESPVLQEVRRSTAICAKMNACRKCEVRHWCLGGCRGETLATRGDLRLNAWDCDEQKKAVLEVMWALSETPDIVRRAQALEL